MEKHMDKNEVDNYIVKDWGGYSFYRDEYRDNKEIVLNVLRYYPTLLIEVSDELKNDKEVVLEAVKQNGSVLRYASKRLKNDKEVVLTAVRKDCGALKDASEELKGDREIVLEAVKQGGCMLQYASDELKNDREIVLTAVKENGNALEYASDELKDDEEVVEEAMKTSNLVINFASKRLYSAKEFNPFDKAAREYYAKKTESHNESTLDEQKNDTRSNENLVNDKIKLLRDKLDRFESLIEEEAELAVRMEQIKSEKEQLAEEVNSFKL